jgi:hypothetical protein
MTDPAYHMYWAAVFAQVAQLWAGLGDKDAAHSWSKICIYHLALAFFRLSYECRECERYR